MSYQCEICHKGLMRGNLVSHSKQRMHRLYRPNLHTAKAVINGATKNVRVCTKCLRKLKRPERVTPVPIVKPVTPVTLVPEVKEMPVEQKAKEVKVKETTVEELMKETTPKESFRKKETKKKADRARKNKKSL